MRTSWILIPPFPGSSPGAPASTFNYLACIGNRLASSKPQENRALADKLVDAPAITTRHAESVARAARRFEKTKNRESKNPKLQKPKISKVEIRKSIAVLVSSDDGSARRALRAHALSSEVREVCQHQKSWAHHPSQRRFSPELSIERWHQGLIGDPLLDVQECGADAHERSAWFEKLNDSWKLKVLSAHRCS
jgi:hypothetical protein